MFVIGDFDVRVGDVIDQLIASGSKVAFRKHVTPMFKSRVRAWIDGRIQPNCIADLTDNELSDVLQLIVEDELMSDVRFQFVAEAVTRLRGEFSD